MIHEKAAGCKGPPLSDAAGSVSAGFCIIRLLFPRDAEASDQHLRRRKGRDAAHAAVDRGIGDCLDVFQELVAGKNFSFF